MAEKGFCLGVVQTLAVTARDPNIRRQPILVGGLSWIGESVLGEGDGWAIPDGGRATVNLPRQRGQAKGHEKILGGWLHITDSWFGGLIRGLLA